MINNKISTEDKILNSAFNIFLLFGYHGTTIQQIAMQAGVNKSAVHYYFRSKERLYTKVVKKVLDLYFDTIVEINTSRKGLEKPTWFLITELYNNKNLFEETLKEIYPNNWDGKLLNLANRLQFTDVRYNNVL
jgi:AcrR family transcriptional regulator